MAFNKVYHIWFIFQFLFLKMFCSMMKCIKDMAYIRKDQIIADFRCLIYICSHKQTMDLCFCVMHKRLIKLIYEIDIIYNYSMMETPKNINKQVKLPMLRQTSEHKIVPFTKLETLKRENSSQNIINQSLKNILKLKNGEDAPIAAKTLLKSGGTFSRNNLMNKFDARQTIDSIKYSKLLKKANDLTYHSKENINSDFKSKDLQKDKLYQTFNTSIEPNNCNQNPCNEDELRRSISQFYQNYLSTGVTLKTIDLQQD